jgi:two-component system sensor histidine kinase TctE
MVNQLLSMARAEDEEQSRRQLPFDLADIATETVQDFVPKALDKRIDLGYEGPAPGDPMPTLMGQPCWCARWCATWWTTPCSTRRPRAR